MTIIIQESESRPRLQFRGYFDGLGILSNRIDGNHLLYMHEECLKAGGLSRFLFYN